MSLMKADMASLYTIDLIALGIMVLSVLIGLIRGFTREILGALGWLGAILVTFWTRSFFQTRLRHWVDNPLTSDLIAIVVVFTVSLFIFLSITRVASSQIKTSVLGGLDRSLGIIFGITRGGVICIILFLMLSLYFKPHKRPPEVTESRAFPYLLKGTEFVATLFPKDTIPSALYHPSPSGHKDETLPILEALSPEELMKTLSQPKAESKPKEEDTGYNDKSRRHMDRLFKNLN